MAMPTLDVRSPEGHWTPGRVRSFWIAGGVLHALVLVSRWDRFGGAMHGVQQVAVPHLAAVPGQDYLTVPGAPDNVADLLAADTADRELQA
ncbi:hypothetical protein [Embleya sp. NPDC001921]